ncbi:MAG: PHP-associated domain-containing protein [Pseudomonadota bacterium]
MLKADLHIHTRRYSGCSNIDPVDALGRAAALGLGLIALTEHGIRWTDKDIHFLIEQSQVENLVVIPGQEAACYSPAGKFQGEFLVFGCPESLGSNKSAERLIEIAHGYGGVVIAAHPFKPAERGGGYYGCGRLVDSLDLDGLEVLHPDYGPLERDLALAAGRSRKLAGLGCGDAHDLRDVGRFQTVFQDDIRDEAALCRAVRERRLKPLDPADPAFNWDLAP